MIRDQLAARGIRDENVLKAMVEVPREAFVPVEYSRQAYADHALPIEHGQTISQPYIVAFMTEVARLGPGDRVLEIGTGSGYGAAVLSRVAGDVYSVEVIEELARSAADRLARLGFETVRVLHGDGRHGWPEHAPYDAILVTAASKDVPPALIEQLKPGGRLVIPLGEESQELVLFEKTARGLERAGLFPVRFVPLVGSED